MGGQELTPKVLENVPYLEAVIKETMTANGKQIPKGWTILLNVKQTHINDPVVYQDDGSHMDIHKGFRPERWLDESTKPSEWLPFGDGKRRCIGERLAMMEMKVFLSTLARKLDRFELVKWHDADEVEWRKETFMARPSDGVEARAIAAA